ncbi:MAG TPA: Glu/Leu/Phe/Val dehydrogenase dimerization domain-containing protein [Longimicrobiales bacterium]|nr:Glu/Leu/Phe/Val dehydrogenase dimerization domain-containing protein [Longimicrobiales bacterium]
MSPRRAGAVRAPRASSASTWRRYATFIRTPPELTIAWQDNPTGARAWLVINSLRGGAAGGGTRMRLGLDPREVIYLAKAMELKFSICGPPIGGAKNGIDFNPRDPRKRDVLERWYHALRPMLRDRYGTGGDLNVDELLDVIPSCHEIGLAHPQEGVVRGYLRPKSDRIEGIFRSLDRGITAPVHGDNGVSGLPLPVADLITGFGLARAILGSFRAQGRSAEGARVLLEGFGAVGAPCGLYLARAGMRIVGIADREKCIVEPAGLEAEEVEALVRAREDKCLPAADPRCLRGADAERFRTVPADLFVSAAASGTLNGPRLNALAAQGVGVIACGANQPFAESKLGATRVQREADLRFSIIPDIVANCGMARAFSYLMTDHPGEDAAELFQAVDETITAAVHEIHARNRGCPTGLLAATLGYALDRIEAT